MKEKMEDDWFETNERGSEMVVKSNQDSKELINANASNSSLSGGVKFRDKMWTKVHYLII